MNAERRETDDEKHGKVQSGFRYEEREKNGEKAENAPKRPGCRANMRFTRQKMRIYDRKMPEKEFVCFFANMLASQAV